MPVFRSAKRDLLKTALAALMAAAAVLPIATQPAEARDGAGLVDIVNRYRAKIAVSPVKLHGVIDEIAVERGRQIAADRQLGHDFDYLIRRLEEEGICWRALGEIVAWNSASEAERLERYVSQWYNSDPHRKIMLGSDYTHAGGSWKTGSDGRHYGVMVFVKICGATPQPVSYAGFTDIAGSQFRDAIAWVTERGLMDGCTASKFCPTYGLTRGQLARALSTGLGLPPTANDYFSDDNGHRHEAHINRLRAAGLTTGCGGGLYCPNRGVKRGQLAVALDRALRLPATARDYFGDDNASPYEDAINRVLAARISTGCGGGSFCAEQRVLRGPSATFVRNAFD